MLVLTVNVAITEVTIPKAAINRGATRYPAFPLDTAKVAPIVIAAIIDPT